MSKIEATNQSTWRSKIKAMGPGILMASAAVGGSHIVSSTQAGASYGWALLGLVILANVFKYPFFRFGAEYTADTGKTLVEGYAKKGKFYLWVFFILNVFFQPWLILREFLFFVQPSLLVPFQCLV